MKHRQSGLSQELSADKAGISVRSGRRIEKGERAEPSQRHWRTRQDPLEGIWDNELLPLLEAEPKLTGLTLWEYLEEQYPGIYPYSLLRTLQRRVKHWHATQGPTKAVIFRQSVPAGQQGLSDFSHPESPITLSGKPFKHLLYQYYLAHSQWRYVQTVQGGESYSALAEGLQNALKHSGGSPKEHRTDSLSAAYKNLSDKQELTQNYEALCSHYDMKPTTNNLGISHENGAVERAHRTFKHRLDQALKLRGGSDFANLRDYQNFIETIVNKLNKRCQTRFAQEQAQLKPLPRYRFTDYIVITARVTTSSTIDIKRSLYTVPSRLIGESITVHLYHDHLDCFVGQTRVVKLTRVYPDTTNGRARRIDYKHIIHSLAAKPQAFRFSQLRDDLLPSESYKQLWTLADQQFEARQACKWIVGILRIAYDYDCEGILANELLQQAQEDKLPDLKNVQSRYLLPGDPPDIPVRQHNIIDYDQLLKGQWYQQEVNHV